MLVQSQSRVVDIVFIFMPLQLVEGSDGKIAIEVDGPSHFRFRKSAVLERRKVFHVSCKLISECWTVFKNILNTCC